MSVKLTSCEFVTEIQWWKCRKNIKMKIKNQYTYVCISESYSQHDSLYKIWFCSLYTEDSWEQIYSLYLLTLCCLALGRLRIQSEWKSKGTKSSMEDRAITIFKWKLFNREQARENYYPKLRAIISSWKLLMLRNNVRYCFETLSIRFFFFLLD